MPEEPTLHPTPESDRVVPAVPSSAAPSGSEASRSTDEARSIGPPPEQVKPVNDAPDYSGYKVGDEIYGVKIHHILLQYADAIVFTSREGSIYFRQNLGGRADVALVEFYRLSSKSTARLQRAYARQVNSLLGAALAESLSLDDGGDLRAPFKAIDEFIDERGPIKYILGSNDDWVVFIDKSGELVCDYPFVPEEAAPLLTEFYRLRQLGKASLRTHEVEALTHILGTELSIALQRRPVIEAADAFAASRDFIQLRNDSRMRVRYVAASLGAAVIFGLSAWSLLRDDLGLLLGCVGGVIGAAVSILQRSADLEIRRFLPPVQVITQGSVRITLGVLFSLIVVAAARANIALGSFAASENALFIAGVVAGFSERFVPDLLTKIAADSPKTK